MTSGRPRNSASAASHGQGTGAEIGLRVRIVETETAIALASVSASATASSGNVFVRLPGPFGGSVHGSSPVDAAVQQAVVALAEEVVAAFAELQAANELEMSEEAPED